MEKFQVDVTKLWANRLLGDWKLPEAERYTKWQGTFNFRTAGTGVLEDTHIRTALKSWKHKRAHGIARLQIQSGSCF